MEIENQPELEEYTSENSENLISFDENQNGFDASLIIKQDLIERIKSKQLKLSKESIFNMPSLVSRLLKRKNEIFYFVSTREMHVDIKDTSGAVYLPLITKAEINKNLQNINPEIRSKLTTVHLGAIKILLKSEFQEGINSPIKMALIDNRINDRNDCILGAARGNLAYQKFMFTVYPKFGLSLNSKNLDKVLSFVHEFERSNLMNEGDKVFSITYLVGYAISNSHHSVEYKHKKYIELDDVFSEIGSVNEKKFSDISPVDNSWAINIAKNKKVLGEPYKSRVVRNNLEIGEPSRTSFCQNNPSQRDILMNVSKRVDDLGRQLEQMS